MASLEELFDDERDGKKEDQDDKDKKGDGADQNGDAKMTDADGEKKEEKKEEEEEDIIDIEILNSSTRDIQARRRMIENEIRINKSEFGRLNHEKQTMQEKIKDNVEKIENNRYVLRSIDRASEIADLWRRQTTPLPCRQRSGNPRPRRDSGSSRGRRQHRP
jgi:26S proteasome regulatory subunit T5